MYFMADLGFDFTFLTSYLHNFTDAGRRSELLGSEIKDFITHSTANSVNTSTFASVPLVPEIGRSLRWPQRSSVPYILTPSPSYSIPMKGFGRNN